MSYNDEIQRGAGVNFDCQNTKALDTVDGLAVHLRYKDIDNVISTKFSNNVVEDHEQTIIAVDLSAVPATFTLKLTETVTSALIADQRIDWRLYSQVADTDHDSNIFRPISVWTPLGTTSKDEETLVDIS